ncbi:cytochrome P450 [Cristinia sonorae]|uniref:Cytochrome P450 n=1 Tax=Cristinia sonorae TaxID=1940300 RepID=A0A8K0URD3_9AGAR|nr:cytochrome P450 [Cristinia sonorae]
MFDYRVSVGKYQAGDAEPLTHICFNRLEPFSLPSLFMLLVIVPATLSTFLNGHHPLFLRLGFAFATYHGVLLTSITLYRLSPLHPLAKYPGPIRLKLSTWWVYQMATRGKRHEFIRALHEHYAADVIRTGKCLLFRPNEISIRDASAIAPIMGPNGLPKGPMWDGRARYSTDRLLIGWRDPTMHAKRRQPWTRGLSTAAIKDYEPTLAERVTQLVDLVSTRRGEIVDLADMFRKFSFDFMGDMAFGGGFELMRDGDVHDFMRMMQAGTKDSVLTETIPWFSYHAPTNLSALVDAATLRATERIMKGTTRKDLFHYLNNDDGALELSPPLSAVIPEGALVTIAGSDTTSATLSNALYLLLTHPNVYRRVQEEIDRFYPPDENSLDCKFHPKMRILDAVINETLRLYPVVPSGSQRATQRKGFHLDSCYIPPYTTVRVHTWSIHRDSRNFSPSPNSFWPDRWLIASNLNADKYHPCPETFTHNTDAFHPFSYGPANCVGKNLAMKELKMAITHLLHRVNVRLAEGYDVREWDQGVKDFFTMDVGGLPVVISPREAEKHEAED